MYLIGIVMNLIFFHASIQKYLAGWRLPRPSKCPPEMYRIMYDCWLKIPDSRKQPQAMVRDVHQILYHCKFLLFVLGFKSCN